MQSIKEIEKVINERNLKPRIIKESEKYGFETFAYCVEDDVFCDRNISYSDYIRKHYICFTMYGDGEITAGVSFEECLPLLQKMSEENTLVIRKAVKKKKLVIKKPVTSTSLVTITKDSDKSYLDYIDKIKSKSFAPVKYDYKGREVYIIKISGATLIVKFSKNKDGYIDFVLFQVRNDKTLVEPVTFEMGSPKQLYEKFFTAPPLTYERISHRYYGQPKLTKPEELKGIKQSFSGDYIPKKCSCPCFCKDNDLYILHHDFFSSDFVPPDEKDFDKPQSYLLKKYFNQERSEKFIYANTWASIVLRNEAWVVFRNIKAVAERSDSNELAQIMVETMINSDNIARENLKGYVSFELQWERFYEDISKKYLSYLTKRST